ncbi:postreplication repair E3 ubiquitin-protein ligase RAD18-like, partial [Contarinia nasturtii]|uniref:postreplication repair E3 ubiquitin-protein ligase RAD18-like n=1 Tax=Contarinia nasturtii TaxID=265458 RepID=UPI0012D38C6C
MAANVDTYQCSICRDLLWSEQISTISTCGHTFHDECIRWCLHTDERCPLCRLTSNRRNLVKLIFTNGSDLDTRPTTTKTECTKMNKATLEATTSAFKPSLSDDVKERVASNVAFLKDSNLSLDLSSDDEPIAQTSSTSEHNIEKNGAIVDHRKSRNKTTTDYFRYNYRQCVICEMNFTITSQSDLD